MKFLLLALEGPISDTFVLHHIFMLSVGILIVEIYTSLLTRAENIAIIIVEIKRILSGIPRLLVFEIFDRESIYFILLVVVEELAVLTTLTADKSRS